MHVCIFSFKLEKKMKIMTPPPNRFSIYISQATTTITTKFAENKFLHPFSISLNVTDKMVLKAFKGITFR